MKTGWTIIIRVSKNSCQTEVMPDLQVRQRSLNDSFKFFCPSKKFGSIFPFIFFFPPFFFLPATLFLPLHTLRFFPLSWLLSLTERGYLKENLWGIFFLCCPNITLTASLARHVVQRPRTIEDNRLVTFLLQFTLSSAQDYDKTFLLPFLMFPNERRPS